MRYLKKKIAGKSKYVQSTLLTHSLHQPQEEDLSTPGPKILTKTKKISTNSCGRKRSRPLNQIVYETYQQVLVHKNAVKNFGRAIAAFACSKLSEPYLQEIETKISFERKSFLNYAYKMKSSIQSLPSFREALLVREGDSPTTRSHKQVFQKIAEIFVKYFSVNWIFSGKVLYKQEYLKLRGAMLQRIKNQEVFSSLPMIKS